MNCQLQSGLISPHSPVYQSLFPINGSLSPGEHAGKTASQTGGWMLRGFMGFRKPSWFRRKCESDWSVWITAAGSFICWIIQRISPTFLLFRWEEPLLDGGLTVKSCWVTTRCELVLLVPKRDNTNTFFIIKIRHKSFKT